MSDSNAQNATQLPVFDTLWNYRQPAETEKKFREIIPQAEIAGDVDYLAQLQTQIARTQGLQGKFDDAGSTLDEVESLIHSNPILQKSVAKVRFFLERGRVHNSSGHPELAMPFFVQAFELGKAIQANRYAIDAVHMIAIAEQDPQQQVEWNLQGIEMADADPAQRGWLRALYNNIGESYNSLQDYANAKLYFHKLIEFQIASGQEPDIYTVKDEARATRLLGRPEESLAMVQPWAEKLKEQGEENGWISEELAESLHALGRMGEAKPHFVKAYELLSADDYCQKYEQKKLKRLKEASLS